MKMLASLSILTLATWAWFATCSHTQNLAKPPAQTTATAPPIPEFEATPVVSRYQPIRTVNFNNVSYPNYPVYDRAQKKSVTLRPGQGRPSALEYGDVTGDGIEEAMMMLGIENRGSAIREIVYIFAVENKRPKLLWSFETGDRADGGLRRVYADGGELVVELYGNDRVIGSNLYRGDEGLCCPSSFTRARYKWRGNHFRLNGTPEVFPNPNGHASAVMPDYLPPTKLSP